MRMFDPWIGSRYATEGVRGVRLLILGESHYGIAADERPGFTSDIVRWFGQQHRSRFFTATQRLVTGGRGWVPPQERHEFWECVAFYNYIQWIVGPKPRWRPTLRMWAAARGPFLQTLSEVRPQVILVLGRELMRDLPELPPGIAVCAVQHPSSRGFKYADWQPLVQMALDAATPKPMA